MLKVQSYLRVEIRNVLIQTPDEMVTFYANYQLKRSNLKPQTSNFKLIP